MSARIQLSLYVPEPHRRAIDVVRSKLDARQHALIPAHVTACREDEVPDWSLVSRRLQALRRVRVTLEFAEPVELPGGGVILPVSDGTDEFDALRRYVLGGFDGPVRIHRPHITLLHPRHAAGSGHVLGEVRSVTFPARIVFEQASIIEQIDGGLWRQLETYPRPQDVSGRGHR